MHSASDNVSHQGIAILLVTNDKGLAETMQHLLRPNGYHVSLAATSHAALSLAQGTSFKIGLIDRRQNMITLLRHDPVVRNIPMVALQPHIHPCTEEELLEELDAGFDIVLSAHSHRELLARIKALLRRQELQSAPTREYRINEISMNLDRYEVLVQDRPVQLTPKEFQILRVFLQHPGQVLSRQNLLNLVWGMDYALEEHALDVHIHALRHKLEYDPSSPRFILTIRGVGYKLSNA